MRPAKHSPSLVDILATRNRMFLRVSDVQYIMATATNRTIFLTVFEKRGNRLVRKMTFYEEPNPDVYDGFGWNLTQLVNLIKKAAGATTTPTAERKKHHA